MIKIERDKVCALSLYSILELKYDFRIWIDSRVLQYGFKKNVDYYCNPDDSYYLSIDTAKKFAMAESTRRGMKAVRYLMKYEKYGQLEPPEHHLCNAIKNGDFGFRNGWASSLALNNLLKRAGIKLPYNMRPGLIRGFGYIPHPHLPGGRVNKDIIIEGGKPRLYIKHDNPHIKVTRPSEISSLYCKAQGYADAG